MIAPRPRRARATKHARRGFSLVHTLTIILVAGIILSTLGLGLVSLRKVRASLRTQLQTEQTWRRLSSQFRIDCHAATEAIWLDDAAPAERASQPGPTQPDAAPPDAAQPEVASSEQDLLLQSGKRLSLVRADGSVVDYVVLQQRVVRRERLADQTSRLESYVVPEGMELQWSWRRRDAHLLELQLQEAAPANNKAVSPPQSDRRRRTVLSVVGLNGDQSRNVVEEEPTQ